MLSPGKESSTVAPQVLWSWERDCKEDLAFEQPSERGAGLAGAGTGVAGAGAGAVVDKVVPLRRRVSVQWRG